MTRHHGVPYATFSGKLADDLLGQECGWGAGEDEDPCRDCPCGGMACGCGGCTIVAGRNACGNCED